MATRSKSVPRISVNGRSLDFNEYWDAVDIELERVEPLPTGVEEMPLRSTEGSTGYGVTLTSLGRYQIFAWYSVPKGRGPFPAVLQTPGYGSVVHVPPYERRQRYAVLALCHRGQRRSDLPYAATYPGLLTDKVDDAREYVWRSIVADCVKSFDFLLGRREVDKRRIAVVGNDLAAITAALRPQGAALLVTGDLLFRDTYARLPRISDYPLEEFNDYLRANPRKAAAVRETLGLFDPLGFASRVKAKALIHCVAGAKSTAGPLCALLGRRAELRVMTGRGYIDHTFEEEWLSRALAA